jgi:hypothetical protein
MSSAKGSKKRRVAPSGQTAAAGSGSSAAAAAPQPAAATPVVVNSFQLVKGRNLPLANELRILDFVHFEELGRLAFLSKAMRGMCVQYFNTAHSVSVTRSGDLDDDFLASCSLLKHCAQLRSLSTEIHIDDAKHASKLRVLIAQVIYSNSARFSSFDDASGEIQCLPVLAALGACSQLQKFADGGVYDTANADVYGTAVQRVFESNRSITRAICAPTVSTAGDCCFIC